MERVPRHLDVASIESKLMQVIFILVPTNLPFNFPVTFPVKACGNLLCCSTTLRD